MEYKERLDFIKSKINETSDKTKLKEFVESVRTSSIIKTEDKGILLDSLEIKINGRKFSNKEILQDIEDGSADIDDIN